MAVARVRIGARTCRVRLSLPIRRALLECGTAPHISPAFFKIPSDTLPRTNPCTRHVPRFGGSNGFVGFVGSCYE